MKRIYRAPVIVLGLLLAPGASLRLHAQEPVPPVPPAPAIAPTPAVTTTVVPTEVRKRVEEALVSALKDAEASTAAALQTMFVGGSGAIKVRVDVDLKDVPVRDALKRVLDQSRQKYIIQDDVPNEQKVRLDAKSVQLNTVLDVITQTAGVGWRQELQEKKDEDKNKTGKREYETVIRVGKNIKSNNVFSMHNILRVTPDAASRSYIYPFWTSEQRSTFTCPHCKGQATVLRRNQQPRCTTCQRPFQAGWDFCPNDGAKRPATPGAWKFCPICGKEVSSEEAEKNTTTLFDPSVYEHQFLGFTSASRVRESVHGKVKASAAAAAVRAGRVRERVQGRIVETPPAQ